MNFDADIGVVGGGPVGLATAILARLSGFSVVVWEPRADGPIDKACGEGLMPSALSALEQIGVEVPPGHVFRGIAYIDGEDAGLRATGDFPSPARGVRRLELQQAMRARAVELGVGFRPERVRELEQDPDGVEVAGHRVRWLVGADGLHSTVRTLAGLETSARSDRFGVRRHYRVAPWSEHVEVYWSELGEAYVTPVSDDEVGVAILFEPPGRFDELLEAFPVLAQRLGSASPSSEDRGAGPFGVTASAPMRERVFLVGDAAGYVDALTGEGIAIGVASAFELVRSLAEGSPGSYPRRMARRTRLWRWSTRGLLALTRWRPAHRPLIRLLRAVPTIFDLSLRLIGRPHLTMSRASCRDDEGIGPIRAGTNAAGTNAG